ncbi:MAG: hypothetical protein IBX46_01870 [Desulfuromonadales bacterium]|nr:hypothetical protein [Desulfuromonadales bacterium]
MALDLILDLVHANGLAHAQIHQQRAMLTLPKARAGAVVLNRYVDRLPTHCCDKR